MIRLQRLDPSPAGDVAAEWADDETWPNASLRHVLAGQGRATRIAWSPDGSLLAVPSRDRTIRIYDGATGVLRAHLHGHVDAVLSACWSPDGRRLASGGYDRQLVLWGPLPRDRASPRWASNSRTARCGAWRASSITRASSTPSPGRARTCSLRAPRTAR